MVGYQGNVSKKEENTVKKIRKYLDLDKWSFDIWTSQKCKYLFISLRFREKSLTWKEIPKPLHDSNDPTDMYSIGPSFFPTGKVL